MIRILSPYILKPIDSWYYNIIRITTMRIFTEWPKPFAEIVIFWPGKLFFAFLFLLTIFLLVTQNFLLALISAILCLCYFLMIKFIRISYPKKS